MKIRGLVKVFGLSLLFVCTAPTAIRASVAGGSPTVAMTADGEDLEAVRERLRTLFYDMMARFETFYKDFLDQSEMEDISPNNRALLKETILSKTETLMEAAPANESLRNDMQAIVEALNCEVDDSDSKEKLENELEDCRYELDYLYQQLEESTSMEQLAELEAQLYAMRDRIAYVEEEVWVWLKEHQTDEPVYSTKTFSGFYETMWQWAEQLNCQLFKTGDVLMAKGLIFKVLDAERKTCQLGRGEGNWWPEDLWAAEELSHSECFEYVNYKSKLTLPNQVLGFTLTVVGEAAFNQKSLDAIVLNDDLEEIGDDALASYGLKEIFIPAKVKRIGSLAFSRLRTHMQRFEVDARNPYLKHTDDYKGVVETATRTLVAACEELVIPDDVTALGDGVFYYCYFETKALPEGLRTIGDHAFMYCEKMKSVQLPDGLQDIGDHAFFRTGLEEVSLPASLTGIGKRAFQNCSQLATIRVHWDNPPAVADDLFCLSHYEGYPVYGDVYDDTIYERSALYVPKGLRDVYAQTGGWSKFQKILEEGEVDLDPFEGVEETDFADDLKDVEDLSGVVVNDIYYAMDTDNGDGYDETEQCLVFNAALDVVDEDSLNNTPALPDDFYGICFMVPAGSGRVTVDVETSGSRTIGVKIGLQPARRFAPTDRQQVTVDYTVSSPSYVYVYPSNKEATSRRRVAMAGPEAMKVYSMKWEKLSDPDGISTVQVAEGDGAVYNLNGQRVERPAKGLYVKDGRKLMVR